MSAPGAFVIAILMLASIGDGKELLRNGGFESGLDGWRPLDMSHTAKFDLDTQVANSGKQSLRMERKGQGAPDFLKAVIDLQDAKGKISCSIAYQVAKDSRVHIDTYFSDEKGDALGKGYIKLVDAKTTKGFEVAHAEYAVPKGAKSFGINVVMDKPGTAWIDSASVMSIGATNKTAAKKSGTNLIENGTFDADIAGWSELSKSTGTSKSVRDTAAKATGPGALKITRTNPRLCPEDGVHTTVADPGESQKFKLSFKARVGGDARAIACAQAFDAYGIVIATERLPVESSTFTPAALVLNLPERCDRIVVSFAVRGAGDAWIDDVVLESQLP